MASNSKNPDLEELRKNAKLAARKAGKKPVSSSTSTSLIIAGVILSLGILSSFFLLTPENSPNLIQALDPTTITKLNQLNLSFKVKPNNYFKDWNLVDVKLATQTGSSQQVRALNICKSYFSEFTPQESFDLRDEFPACIQEPQDQLNCSSSYSFAAASAAAERFCIKSHMKQSPKLSVQQIVSCAKKNSGCVSGNIDTAWEYIREFGLVEQSHFPYTVQDMKHPECVDTSEEKVFRVTDVCATNTELGIMKEIQENGPVVSLVQVFSDFLPYSNGVYVPSELGSRIQGVQAVSVVGWGTDGEKKFWIVKNSWGTSWGEGGYALVVRGNTQLMIEDLAIAGTPVVEAGM